LGLIAAYVVSGAHSFDVTELPNIPSAQFSRCGAFPLVFIGFAILAGMWPFHTWAPTGHVAAPTAASMLLAGVVMKLGVTAVCGVAMTLFPRIGRVENFFAILAVIGIVYARWSRWCKRF